MSATPVSICSNALLLLGDKPIASFEESTDRAALAASLWDTARDHVLRRHPWNCAIKRVILAPDTTPPAFDYTAQFSLPADWLRTLSVGELGERPDFKIEGRKLLMDGSVCKLRYVFRNEVPATWDAMLVHAMTQVMRALFAYPITESASMQQVVEAVLAPILREARAVDGQEEPGDAFDDSPLLDARYIGSGSSLYRGGW